MLPKAEWGACKLHRSGVLEVGATPSNRSVDSSVPICVFRPPALSVMGLGLFYLGLHFPSKLPVLIISVTTLEVVLAVRESPLAWSWPR